MKAIDKFNTNIQRIVDEARLLSVSINGTVGDFLQEAMAEVLGNGNGQAGEVVVTEIPESTVRAAVRRRSVRSPLAVREAQLKREVKRLRAYSRSSTSLRKVQLKQEVKRLRRSSASSKYLDLLRKGPKTPQELAKALRVSESTVRSRVSTLKAKGGFKIAKDGHKYVLRAS